MHRNFIAICIGAAAVAAAVSASIELAFAPSVFNHALTGWISATIGWGTALYFFATSR